MEAKIKQLNLVYSKGGGPWDTGPCSELKRRLENGDLPKRGKALDLGCGHGVQSLILAENGLDVVGLDLSKVAINYAKQQASRSAFSAQLDFYAGDMTKVRNIGEPFDFVFDRGCYHIFRRINVDGYVSALKSFTKAGSIILILGFKYVKTLELPHIHFIRERDIQEELGKEFEFLDIGECDIDRPQGYRRRPKYWSLLMKRN